MSLTIRQSLLSSTPIRGDDVAHHLAGHLDVLRRSRPSTATTPLPATIRLSLREIRPLTVPWMTRSSSPEISPSMTMLVPITVLAISSVLALRRAQTPAGSLTSILDRTLEARAQILENHARRLDAPPPCGRCFRICTLLAVASMFPDMRPLTTMLSTSRSAWTSLRLFDGRQHVLE